MPPNLSPRTMQLVDRLFEPAQATEAARWLEDECHRRVSQGTSPDPDILDRLLALQGNSADSISAGELADHVFTFLVAGVDPTALALAWLVGWVIQHPSIYERLRDESARFFVALNKRRAIT